MSQRLFLVMALVAAVAAAGPIAQQAPTTAAPVQPVQNDALLGDWSGQVTYRGDTRKLGLRFEINERRKVLVVFITAPELKFRHLGPVPVEETAGHDTALNFSFQLSADAASLTGAWTFDGHTLPMSLTKGTLPSAVEPVRSAIPTATPVWTFTADSAFWSSPAAAEGVVYVGSAAGTIYAINAADGRPRWSVATKGRVMARPTVDGAQLYAPSDDGLVYKLDRATGRVVWTFDTHGGAVARELPSLQSARYDYAASAVTLANGVAYVGSADGAVYAVDAATGRQRWRFATGGPVRSTPAVSRGLVFFGSYDHHVYAVDARTGTLRWKRDTLRPVVSAPLVDRSTVYVGSRSSDLFALDVATGAIKWSVFYWSSWVESPVRLDKGVLYVGSSDLQKVFALDAANGLPVWAVDVDGSAWSTPAVTPRAVYVGVVGVPGYFIPHRGGFFALDRATGRVTERLLSAPIEGSPTYGFAASPLVTGGRVICGGLDGVLYAFLAR